MKIKVNIFTVLKKSFAVSFFRNELYFIVKCTDAKA